MNCVERLNRFPVKKIINKHDKKNVLTIFKKTIKNIGVFSTKCDNKTVAILTDKTRSMENFMIACTAQ